MATKRFTFQQLDMFFPEGSVNPAGWSFAVTRQEDGVGQHQDLPAEGGEVVMELQPGTYQASVVRMDANGNQIGNVSTLMLDPIVDAPKMIAVKVAGDITVEDVVATAGPIAVQ